MIRVANSRRRLVGPLMIFGVALALPALGLPGTASAATPTCFGQAATIVASADSERIEGTPGPDVIVGREGRQTIFGGGGNDLICGRAGSDVIDGGDGDDRLAGQRGPDFVSGVDGNDLVVGGPGADSLNFGDEENGDDVVRGGGGNDDLHAGVGVDRLFGNAGDDFLAEGETDAPLIDLFAGGLGTDTCFAGAEDTVRGCEILS